MRTVKTVLAHRIFLLAVLKHLHGLLVHFNNTLLRREGEGEGEEEGEEEGEGEGEGKGGRGGGRERRNSSCTVILHACKNIKAHWHTHRHTHSCTHPTCVSDSLVRCAVFRCVPVVD